jgi:hypothetical protein
MDFNSMLESFSNFGLPGIFMFIVLGIVIYILRNSNTHNTNNVDKLCVQNDKLCGKIDKLVEVMLISKTIEENNNKTLQEVNLKLDKIDTKITSIEIRTQICPNINKLLKNKTGGVAFNEGD